MSGARATHGILLGIVAALTIATVAGIVVLYRAPAPAPGGGLPGAELVDATLLSVVADPTAGAAPGLSPGAVDVTVTARIDASGEVVTFAQVDEDGQTLRAGQRVRLAVSSAPGTEPVYGVSDIRRELPLAVLAGAFVLAVLLFGRWQGLRALLGLALSAVLIVVFLVPSILAGQDPVAVALVAGVAIMIATLYLSHGPSPKTTAAVVGTALALALTVGLAWVVVQVASLTGLSSEEARLVNLEVGGVSFRGLLLAGIVLGGLGVLDDVTTSQASIVFELARADPRASFGRLTAGALAVGRDHVAATVNTLFLAYVGAALPLVILFSLAVDPLPVVLTSEVVAVEIVRTLVGSIGLIAAVPLTPALAAVLARGEVAGEPARAEAAHATGAEGTGAADRPVAGRRPGRPGGRRGRAGRGGGAGEVDRAGRAGPARDLGPPPGPDPGGAGEDDWVADLRRAYGRPDDRP